MNKTDLTTYLNDHHAGSLAALEMLDHLIEKFEGKTLGQFFKELRAEIKRDQQTLENVIEKSVPTNFLHSAERRYGRGQGNIHHGTALEGG